MQHRSSTPKRPRDMNARAFDTVARLTGTAPPQPEPEPENPVKAAAALLGRQGGLKGGPIRAERLSAERRSEIARAAAQTRWRKEKAEK